jgi:hypothetical protein
MDVIGPVTFLTELTAKILGSRSNRPRLGVRILSFRPDRDDRRLVFRASVLNYGRIIASDCAGYWTILDPGLRELSSGQGVFWSPTNDDDYDFRNRQFTSATIEFNERRFCWAELDVTSAAVEGTGVNLFPYDCTKGVYAFTLIVEYGQYKSFDFVGIEVPDRIPTTVSERDAIQGIEVRWKHRRGLGGLRRGQRIQSFVANTDYHNYVRPI